MYAIALYLEVHGTKEQLVNGRVYLRTVHQIGGKHVPDSLLQLITSTATSPTSVLWALEIQQSSLPMIWLAFGMGFQAGWLVAYVMSRSIRTRCNKAQHGHDFKIKPAQVHDISQQGAVWIDNVS